MIRVALDIGIHSPGDKESGSSWDGEQASIALSTVEVKNIAVGVAAREAKWLRKLLAGLFGQMLKSTMIHSDNESCVKL